MSTIKLTPPSGTIVGNGRLISFKAPCSSDGVTHVLIGDTEYPLVNAIGEHYTESGGGWAAGAYITIAIKDILGENFAFVLNDAPNKYVYSNITLPSTGWELNPDTGDYSTIIDLPANMHLYYKLKVDVCATSDLIKYMVLNNISAIWLETVTDLTTDTLNTTLVAHVRGDIPTSDITLAVRAKAVREDSFSIYSLAVVGESGELTRANECIGLVLPADYKISTGSLISFRIPPVTDRDYPTHVRIRGKNYLLQKSTAENLKREDYVPGSLITILLDCKEDTLIARVINRIDNLPVIRILTLSSSEWSYVSSTDEYTQIIGDCFLYSDHTYYKADILPSSELLSNMVSDGVTSIWLEVESSQEYGDYAYIKAHITGNPLTSDIMLDVLITNVGTVSQSIIT